MLRSLAAPVCGVLLGCDRAAGSGGDNEPKGPYSLLSAGSLLSTSLTRSAVPESQANPVILQRQCRRSRRLAV